LDIVPTTPGRIAKLHVEGSNERGYPVYAPMFVVRAWQGATCKKTGAANLDACPKPEDQTPVCMVSDPIKVRDESRPFMISHRVGLGTADVSVAITDGWMLGSFKDASSNGELFKTLLTAGQVGGFAAKSRSTDGSPTCPEGLFQWRTSSGKVELVPVSIEEGSGKFAPKALEEVDVLVIHLTEVVNLAEVRLDPLCKGDDCPKQGVGGLSVQPKTKAVFRFPDREAARKWIETYGKRFDAVIVL
jgi:hypothetical protein